MANRLLALNPGEEVVVDVRPHWWYLAGPVVTVVVVIAGASAAGIESAPTWAIWAVLVVLALALIWLVARYIRWASTRLLVTTTRLVERRGVISRRGREIPLSALTDISYHQTIFERVIGAGDVLLESAGRDSREVFPDLPHPARIHNEIYLQMERSRRGPTPGSAPEVSIPAQIEQLDHLRPRGLITDAEFETKKTKLLDRL